MQALTAATGNQSVIGEAKRHLMSFLATVNVRLATRSAAPPRGARALACAPAAAAQRQHTCVAAIEKDLYCFEVFFFFITQHFVD